MKSTLFQRCQNGALAVAIVTGALGLLAAGGCSVVPEGRPGLAGLIHVLLLGLSIGAGLLAALRTQEVETARWEAVNEPMATKGEREYAHREAESQRRGTSTIFLLAPLGIAFWLAHVFDTEGVFSLSDLFLVTPVLGYLLTLLIASRRLASPPPGLDLD